MMKIENILAHRELKPMIKELKQGEFLFRQGVEARTMVLLLKGQIELRAEKKNHSGLVGMVEPGQVLGEKAILSDKAYRRSFSARAAQTILYLELSHEDLDKLRKAAPAALSDILRQTFLTTTLRLDRANYLTQVLRSSDNVQRLVHLITFLAKCYGGKTPQGNRVRLSHEIIQFHIDMEPGRITDCLNELVVKDLLIRQVDDWYIIPDPQAMMNFLPELSKRFKSGFFDELESLPFSTLA